MIKLGKPVPDDVEERLPRLVDELARDPRLEALWLYGSRARGEADALSDVDLAVLARADAVAADLWEWEREWTGLAAQVLRTDEVAVQSLNRMPMALRAGVLRSSRLLWARSPERATDFEAVTLKQYLDFKPYLEAYDRELLARAASGRLR